jgi:hypothetical protein
MVKKTNQKPALKKPPRLDVKKLRQAGEQIVRENEQWLKEMADK